MTTLPKPDQPLAGRVALVTGATDGIGRATALRLLSLGAAVIGTGRRPDRLDQLLADGIDPFPGDVRDPGFAADAVASAIRQFGHLDVVVVNAGRGLAGSLLTCDRAAWQEVFDTNVIAAADLMRAAALTPGVSDIVVVSSVGARHVSPFSSFYCASKAAISMITEGLRRELAAAGSACRVTQVLPGVVRSGFQDAAGYNETDAAGNLVNPHFKICTEKWARVMDPDDVAGAIAAVLLQPAHVALHEVVVRSVHQDYP